MNPASAVFSISSGAGGFPKLLLSAPDGARAEIYLHSAQVTSWIPSGDAQRLFMSRRSQFRAGAPICGGIPVIFPQFGTLGPLVQHGFARLMEWEFRSAQAVGTRATAVFSLRDTEDSRRRWDYPFAAELTVLLGDKQLAVTLAITNTGPKPMTFTSGLHTYFAVADLAAATVENLAGIQYRDAAAGWTDHRQTQPALGFTGEVNRIYFNTPAELCLSEPTCTTLIRSEGFADTVIWNPSATQCPTMPDLEPDAYLHFVCVEAAAIGNPIQLAPGERWQGAQILLA